MRIYDLRQKEVINIIDGKRLGFIDDVEIDEENGVLKSAIIPNEGKILGLFGKETDYVIPWGCITRLGEDIILVKYDSAPTFEEGRKPRSRKARLE